VEAVRNFGSADCACVRCFFVLLGDKVLTAKPTRQCGYQYRHGAMLACILVFAAWGALSAGGQQINDSISFQAPAVVPGASALPLPAAPGSQSLAQWVGFPVRRISFEGVSSARLASLIGHLPQAEGDPLSAEKVKKSLRQLYATGLYDSISLEAARDQDGVVLVFRGTPRIFIGTVSVDGAKGATLNVQLERASQLETGARFTQEKMDRALVQMRQTLATNGFHQPKITPTQTLSPNDQLVDLLFHVDCGVRARVGSVDVAGDSGMSAEEFRRHAHLRTGSQVSHDTANRALVGALKQYRKQDRLEAEIKVDSQKFDAASGKTNYHFTSNRGPIVQVMVEGASLSSGRVKHVIPIFEEGTVDEDLLNEGNRRLRDYYQRMGFFDVKVEHEQKSAQADQLIILYQVKLGPRRRVERVSVDGNHYFDSATLKEFLSVHAADMIDHHGAYSQALVNADINALQAVYQNNGFPKAKVRPEINAAPEQGEIVGKTAPLSVVYHIDEGQQVRVESVRLEGNDHVEAGKLVPLLNTSAGQLLSSQNLVGDREALLTDYLSRGFDQARVEVTQKADPGDANKVNVVFQITEGEQIFVRQVLLRGLHFTRPSTVARAITLHSGDPLDQTALTDIQRNFYDFALFSEVDTAVENASGAESYKTVLLQVSEARRWVLTGGFGFESQTGTPQNNCASADAGGVPCNPNGKTGVSPRILLDLTRNNLFGREQSASLRGNYGLLEQKLDLLFQNPHFDGNRNFGLTFSIGYANSLDVSTYVASRLEGSMRWTEHFNSPGSHISKANTLVYQFDFRRVKVEAGSLQVYPAEIKELSTAVRVAGPAITWIRDTRDSALDARHGTYTSFQDFLSGDKFGAQAQFNRLDVSNSSYYAFSKRRFVLARNTRYGQERAYGPPSEELIPLPERLFAGGAASLRSFASNSAGPRDPETGYPIGGAGALINSTELRLPPPMLPWFGDSISFVLFHDMGNVFTNAGDAWASALRTRQPGREGCRVASPPTPPTSAPTPTGPATSTGQQGSCNFNYFSHAPGVGLRYHTPVGPIRLDFSYNLNPPLYPVNINYSQTPYYANPRTGEGTHFSFFFSLGQTF